MIMFKQRVKSGIIHRFQVCCVNCKQLLLTVGTTDITNTFSPDNYNFIHSDVDLAGVKEEMEGMVLLFLLFLNILKLIKILPRKVLAFVRKLLRNPFKKLSICLSMAQSK